MKKNPSYRELKRDKIRTVFWITFPQGIRKEDKKYITYSNTMYARTLKRAWKLLLKYNGAFIKRLYETKHYERREISIICRREDSNLSYNDLWDKYASLPEINLGEK